MRKEYRYPQYNYLISIVVFIIVGIVPYGLMADALTEGNISYMLIVILILVTYAYGFFLFVTDGMTKIKLTNNYLIIDKPHSPVTIRWHEIEEFGRYNGHRGLWVYYLKCNGSGDKTIKIGTEYLRDDEDMVKTVFWKAPNARFVEQRDTSSIPFLRRLESFEWELER